VNKKEVGMASPAKKANALIEKLKIVPGSLKDGAYGALTGVYLADAISSNDELKYKLIKSD
jgi:hypothetical protein